MTIRTAAAGLIAAACLTVLPAPGHGAPPDAGELVERVLARYQSAATYRADLIGTTVDDEGEADEIVPQAIVKLSYRDEGWLRLSEEELDILVKDGDVHLLLHGDRARARFDAPEPITRQGIAAANPIISTIVGGHALLDALTGDLDPEKVVVDFEDDRAIIRYKAPDPVRMTVNVETGAIVETHVNFGRDVWIRWEVDEEAIDEEIAEEHFASEKGMEYVDVTSLLRELSGEYNTHMIGEPAPDFRGRLLDGDEATLADYEGKVLVMEFWATWCPPCVDTLPMLQRVKDDLDDPGVAFLGMNIDQAPQQTRDDMVRAFMERHGFDFPQLMIGSPVASAYNVGPIPMLMIIRPDGIVHNVKVGLVRPDELKDKIASAREAAATE